MASRATAVRARAIKIGGGKLPPGGFELATTGVAEHGSNHWATRLLVLDLGLGDFEVFLRGVRGTDETEVQFFSYNGANGADSRQKTMTAARS